jgi:hypothetical protein
VTFNPPTFLPPVLAVGQGDSSNGRQQLGSGLVTHRGIIDANCVRAQGNLYPQSGRGLELLYDQTAKQGLIYSYDRDAQVWTDLNLTGKNVMLNAPGGKVSLPAGTVQSTVGTRWIGTYNLPAAGTWYESPVQQTATVTAGNMVRVEASGTVGHSVAGGIVYVGVGIDGAIATGGDSMFCCQPNNGGGNTITGYSFCAYLSSQIATSGAHRFAVFLHTNAVGASMWAGGYQYIWVTEQRA